MIGPLGSWPQPFHFSRESTVPLTESPVRRASARSVIVLPMMWALTALACSKGATDQDIANCILSLVIDPQTTSVEPGETKNLTATVSNSCPAVEVRWESSNTAVATVTDGAPIAPVKGVTAGTATITARARPTGNIDPLVEKSATAQITVTPATVSTIAVTPAAATIPVLGKTQLTAALTSAFGVTVTGADVIWSAPPGTVTVLKTGPLTADVTGTSPGSSTVVATASSKSGTANITVQSVLTVTLAGTGNGRVTAPNNAINCVRAGGANSGTCSANFVTPAAVTLTAAADVGFAFSGWTGACTGIVVTCVITLDQSRNVTATFIAAGGISGVIRHALTSNPIFNATVELRSGPNATTGAPLATTTSANVSGAYSFTGLAAGTYTVVATLTGFVDGVKGAISVSNAVVTAQDAFLMPVLATGQTRIVLTWAALPPDLDAHLTGPAASGRFRICWANVGGEAFAKIDVDDVNGNGPEAATIFNQIAGDYFFYVFNYSVTFDNTAAVPLSASGARVQVWRGSAVIADFPVPSGTGNLWTVFRLNGSVISPINTMTNTVDIGSTGCGVLPRVTDDGLLRRSETQGSGKRKPPVPPPDEPTPLRFPLLLPKDEPWVQS